MKKKYFILLLSLLCSLQDSFSQVWLPIPTGATSTLNTIYFASATHGWAAGNGGNNIVATTDGGNTWTAQSTGLSSLVVWNGIYFTSANNGVVVGPQVLLCKTTNGGSTWSTVNTGTNYILNSVHFSSSTNGYAAGEGSVIIATTDGGSTWTTKSAGVTLNPAFRSIYFASNSVGWVAGDNGLIKKSGDGGTTWATQASGTTQNLLDAYFVSSSKGWIVGANGTILTTSNGGSTWSVQTSGTTTKLRSVHFVSATQGWITGDNGLILTTTNGGTTWTVQAAPQFFNVPLYSVFMNSSTLGWAVGVGVSLIKYCNAPAQPGVISGNTSICVGSTQTYSIAPVPGATSYTWTLPNGLTGTSSSNSITVASNQSQGWVTIYVSANNGSCLSSQRALNVSKDASPAQPGNISGNSNPCVGTNQTFSIVPVSGATSYTWTLPSGWTGTSTSTSIVTNVGNTGGAISVKSNGSNGCSSANRTLNVTVNSIPVSPGVISGNTTICSGTAQTYSITAVAGASSYNWTLPNGWTGNSTTNTLSCNAGTNSGNVSVSATNSCGTSAQTNMAIAVNTSPAAPASIAGSTNVCFNTATSYSISSVSGATSYNWTLPAGWTGTSSTINLVATSGNSSGTISVTASNSCGTSTPKTLSVTVNSAPSTPGFISGTSTVCSGTSGLSYTTNSVASATSYTWSLPLGWTGVSTTNSISSVTAGSASGNISVIASNNCGSSTASTLPISVNNIPASPSVISGPSSICSGISQTYTINNVQGATSYNWTLPTTWLGASTTTSITTTTGTAGGNVSVIALNSCGSSVPTILAVSLAGTGSVPPSPVTILGNDTTCESTSQSYSVNSVAGASSYLWSLPIGWTGTSTTNTINVTTGFATGVITVSAINTCGSSASIAMNVTVNNSPIMSGNIIGAVSVCDSSSQTYTLNSIPGANSYNWILPNGWSGSSLSNSILAFANGISGTVSVTAANGCGTSLPQTLNITLNSLPTIIFSQLDTLCFSSNPIVLQAGIPAGGVYTGVGITNDSIFNPSLSGAGSFLINYTYTDLNSCSNNAYNTQVVDLCLSIEPEIANQSNIKFYPNPANEYIHITDANGAEVVVFNSIGEIVETVFIKTDFYILNIKKYLPGIYFLRVTSMNRPSSHLFIKQISN
ncbi:MAG: T9SS type A sorting domain-containing protein [Bacteroidetes bacterium]|nr:T9SS type A sorting domain-containing protein [Bacteroidota bacterium]